jgi:superkiller protein 8
LFGRTGCLTSFPGEKAGEHWALAISPEGKFLATTTHDGRVNVYDTTKINEEVKAAQTLAQFETKGSFGTCVDIVCWLHIISGAYW